MRRVSFILLVLGFAFVIKAQENEEIPVEISGSIIADTLKKSEERAVKTTFIRPNFKDNWFVTLYGGTAMLRGEDSPKLDFTDRIKPTVGLSVGKWMSPVWGIRLNITGAKVKGFTHWNDKKYGGGAWFVGKGYKDKLPISGWDPYSTYLDIELISDPAEKEIAGKFIEENFLNMDDPQKKGGYSYDVTYMGASVDFLLSLTNSFSSYNPKRFFDLKIFGGLGFSHTFKRKNATAVNIIMQRYGLQGSFRLTNQLSLELEPQVLVLPEIFDRRAGDGNTMDGVYNVMIGLTYKFKDRYFYEPKAVCNEQELLDEINRLRAQLAVPVPIIVNPSFAYITPQVETKKDRAEVGTAYLDFQVGKYQILRDFRNNDTELDKINYTIQSVLSDGDVVPNGIYLKGYASPEGSYESNKRLAENRVKALRDYVISNYDLRSNFFTLDFEPEDWAGFKMKAEADPSIPNKSEILAIINNNDSPDKKERDLKALSNGNAFKYVLNNIFPSLRRTEYRIDYTVRGFSLEESREIIKTRPQHLSLEEMFAVANSYPVGSTDYNNVFETAVRIYNNDPIANLNAANVAMAKGDLESAHKYLLKAGESPEALHARGIYYLLQDKLQNAKQYLERARDAGVKEAATNLELLQKKIDNSK